MSLLTFPILPAGLVVDVLVNLEAGALLPLRVAGQVCPPVETTGEIDARGDRTAGSVVRYAEPQCQDALATLMGHWKARPGRGVAPQ
jgi:hypothetical protein